MIAGILLFGHAGVGLLAALTFFLPSRWRTRALVVCGVIGSALGAAAVAVAGSGESFRGFELGPSVIPVAAGAAAA